MSKKNRPLSLADFGIPEDTELGDAVRYAIHYHSRGK